MMGMVSVDLENEAGARLFTALEQQKVRVGIVGLGYVGLPMYLVTKA